MANNSSEIQEGLDENEKKEAKETKNKSRNVSSLFGSIVEDFVGEKLEDNIDFFDKEQLKEDKNYENIKKFLYEGTDYEDYSSDFNNLSDKQKKDLLERVKKEVIKQKIGIDKNIATAKKLIINEYKIPDPKLFDKKLKELYNEKDGKRKLKGILQKHSARYGFMKKTFGDNIENKENNKNKIDDDLFSQIEGLDPEKLTEEEISLLKKIYNSQMTLEVNDLVRFLGYLDKKNRKAILKHFNPSISLEDLIENKVITKNKAIEILKKSFSNNNIKTNIHQLRQILKKDNFRDIFVDIEDLDEEEITKFLEKPDAVKPLVEEINKARREYEKDSTKRFYDDDLLDFDDEGNIHNNFIDFIRNSTEEISSETITSINKFDKGNYIKVNDGKNDVYYYIDEIDKGGTKPGKHILIKNLYSLIGVRKPEDVFSEMMTYEELYKLLKTIDQSKGQSIDFLTKSEYDKIDKEEAVEENNIKTQKDLLTLLKAKGKVEDGAENLDFTKLRFKDKIKNDEFYRTFARADNKTHSLVFENSGQVMTYSDFYNEFVNDKYKLEKRAIEIDSVLDKLNKNIEDENLKIVLSNTGDKLVYKKDYDNKEAKAIEHFSINDGSRKLISIEKVSKNGVEFSTGTHERKPVEKKDGKGNVIEKKYKISKKYLYTGNGALDDLELFFSKDPYSPYAYDDSKNGNSKVEEDGTKSQFKEKGSFMGAWFTMSSIAEILQGGQEMTQAIKDYLSRGNDLHAAKFAQLFGGMLPKEVQAQLRFNTTEKRKEVIDKIFKQLDEDNASDAMNYIQKRILENKHATPEEVFAAIRYLAEKRGNLYPKGLNAKEGQYVWYKKLGGDINSAEFKKWKENYEKREQENKGLGKKDPTFMKEEDLLENVILKRLGKDGKALYPRVEKDFNKYINNGQANRYKKGEDETGNTHSITDRTNNFLAQLKGREYSRTMGVLTKVTGKDSTFESIYFPGFILSMSGVTKNFNPSDLNYLLKNAYTTPSSGLMFGLNADGIKTYQNTVIDFYKSKGDHKKVNKLKDILDDSKVPTGKDGKPDYEKQHIKRIDDLTKFWDENVEELIDFLNLKDGEIALHKEENENYMNYYNTLKSEMNSGDFKHKEGDFLANGKYQHTAFANVGAKLGAEEFLRSSQNGGYGPNDSLGVAKIFYSRLDDLKKNNKLTIEQKRKIFKEIYNPFEKRVSDAIGAYRSSEKVKDGRFYEDMNKKGLLIQKMDGYDNIIRKEFLDIAFDNFINKQEEDEDGNPINKLREKIQAKVGIDLINNRDYYPEEKVA